MQNKKGVLSHHQYRLAWHTNINKKEMKTIAVVVVPEMLEADFNAFGTKF